MERRIVSRDEKLWGILGYRFIEVFNRAEIRAILTRRSMLGAKSESIRFHEINRSCD